METGFDWTGTINALHEACELINTWKEQTPGKVTLQRVSWTLFGAQSQLFDMEHITSKIYKSFQHIAGCYLSHDVHPSF